MNTKVQITFSNGEVREFLASDKLEELIQEGVIFSVTSVHPHEGEHTSDNISKMYAGNPITALGKMLIMRENAAALSDEDPNKDVVIDVFNVCIDMLGEEITSYGSGLDKKNEFNIYPWQQELMDRLEAEAEAEAQGEFEIHDEPAPVPMLIDDTEKPVDEEPKKVPLFYCSDCGGHYDDEDIETNFLPDGDQIFTCKMCEKPAFTLEKLTLMMEGIEDIEHECPAITDRCDYLEYVIIDTPAYNSGGIPHIHCSHKANNMEGDNCVTVECPLVTEED